MELHRAVTIADSTGPGEARRAAMSLAASTGFDESDCGRVGLVVTELATNIVKHAGRGCVLICRSNSADASGIEILALDNGPGMQDMGQCLRDGFSTAGSSGTGLGAVSRLATEWDIYTAPALGTAALARIFSRGHKGHPRASKFELGAVRVAAPGETQCGDDWGVQRIEKGLSILVVDGLGHGPEAARAASVALGAFRAEEVPDAVLLRVHQASLATRGVAGSCARIDLEAGTIGFSGVGNVAGLLATPGATKSLVCQNGTLGGQVSKIRVHGSSWNRNTCLIMHTDGLNTHTSPLAYPGLLARDATVIAAVLYRDFARGRDDATVVVARETRVGT